MLDDKDKKDKTSDNDKKSYSKSILEETKESFANVGDRALDVGDTLSTIGKSVQSLNQELGGSANLTSVLGANFVDAGQKILLVSKDVNSLEEAIAKSADIQKATIEATGRAYMATGEELAGIVATQEASGVQAKDLLENFKAQGFALQAIPKTMEKVINTARSLGVNVNAVSEGVVKNLDKLNTFNFSNGVEGLTKMAAQSTMFGIEMGKIFQTAEKLFNPEAAIDMAANLQRLGVATGDLIDPLKLMDLGQNNPQELQNQIVEMSKRFTYFNEQNQKFEILPGAKRELREIATAVGMSAEELAKLSLGSSELAKKMGEIRFPELDTGPLTEDQQTMIANLSEMKDGSYKIQFEQTAINEKGERYTTGEKVEKKVSELTSEDLKSLQYQQQQSSKSIEQIASESMGYEKRTANAVEALVGTGRGTLATSRLANKGTEFLNQQIGKLMEISKEVKTKEGREAFNQGVEQVRALVGEYDKAFKSGGGIDESEKKILEEKGEEINKLLKGAAEKAGDVGVKILKMGAEFAPGLLKVIDQATTDLSSTKNTSNNETNTETNTSQLFSGKNPLDEQILSVQNLADIGKAAAEQNKQAGTTSSVSNTNAINNNDNRVTNNQTTNNDLSQTFNQSQQSYNTQNTSTITQGGFNIDFNPLATIQSEQLKIENQSFDELKTLNENSQKNNQTLIDHLSKLQQPVAATNQRTNAPTLTNSFTSIQTPRLQTPFNLSFNPSNQIPNITNISNNNTPSLQNTPSIAAGTNSTLNYTGELTIKVDVMAPTGVDVNMVKEIVTTAMKQKEVQDGIIKNVTGGRIGEYNPTNSVPG